MTRRGAIVAVLSAPLGYYRALTTVHAQSTLPTGPATLSINLDQWAGLAVTHHGKTVFVPVADIFDALKGGTP